MAGFYGRTGIEFQDTLTENLAYLATAGRPLAIRAVTEAAEIIRADAYGRANVSSGVVGHGVGGAHMRDEIAVEVYEYDAGVSARIGIDMSIIPYAAHQEFGPRGKPFLRPAIDENREAAHEKMREVMSMGNMLDLAGIKTKVRVRRFA